MDDISIYYVFSWAINVLGFENHLSMDSAKLQMTEMEGDRNL